jgi:hypothetical protein
VLDQHQLCDWLKAQALRNPYLGLGDELLVPLLCLLQPVSLKLAEFGDMQLLLPMPAVLSPTLPVAASTANTIRPCCTLPNAVGAVDVPCLCIVRLITAAR